MNIMVSTVYTLSGHNLHFDGPVVAEEHNIPANSLSATLTGLFDANISKLQISIAYEWKVSLRA